MVGGFGGAIKRQYIMKNTQELFELVAKAVEQNQRECSPHWFINYSGHVNNMNIKFYSCGWSDNARYEGNDEYLTEDGIQSLYWFIKTRL
jgi:hypothetical protein